MYLYRFINSKDIRDHLEQMRYEFDSQEAAWLIYQCRTASIEEKHKAWNELIDTMPDCRIEERDWFVKRDSLHEFLKDYMFLEKKLLKTFYEEDSAVYTVHFFYGEKEEYEEYTGRWSTDRNRMFRTFQDCMDYDALAYEKYENLLILKHYLNTSDFLALTLLPDYSEMSIDVKTSQYNCMQLGGLLCKKEYELYYRGFNGLCFDFPIPFQKGDILWDPGARAGVIRTPRVFLDTYLKEKDEADRKESVKRGGISDMGVRAYFFDPETGLTDEGVDETTGDPRYDHMNYMNLEYYPFRLKAEKRILYALSNFVKKKISLPLFVHACHQILDEERQPLELCDPEKVIILSNGELY